jgi:hypothetical protein
LVVHDGYRLMVRRTGARVTLYTRNGQEWSDRSPRIVTAARGIVDADVHILPADATAVALALAIASDAMADLLEAPSFLMSMWMSSPGCSRS